MLHEFINHLWQSTLFAAFAGLLTLLLRANRARVRQYIWLAASAKFLVPVSLLIAAGNQFSWIPPKIPQAHRIEIVMEGMRLPAVSMIPVNFPQQPGPAPSSPLTAAIVAIWLTGALGVVALGWTRWRRVRAALQTASPIQLETNVEIPAHVAVMSSSTRLEPGIVGILHPVLLLPQGIEGRLTTAQMDAILTHELCHVRKHDNLVSTIQMLVEALFWFHPMVWRIGARMVEERERACDEEVLRLGREPRIYAEGILKVCEFFVEAPIVCMAGVTGANLRKRIEEIMTPRIARRLDFGKKLLLGTLASAAVAGPVLFGLFTAPVSRAQSTSTDSPKFEVASIKPSHEGSGRIMIQIQPGGRLDAKNVNVKFLIQQAYGVRDFQITNAPSWVNSERFDVLAKAPDGTSNLTPDKLRPMMQALLEERFKLTLHRETKEMPAYTLVVAKGGSKMKEDPAGDGDGPDGAGGPGGPGGGRGGPGGGRGMMRMGRGMVNAEGVKLEFLVNNLANQLGKTIIDKTDLKGIYTFKLEWTPEPGGPTHPGEDAPAADGPSIFTALQEQLGLKLEPTKGPTELLIIDRVERATEN